MQTIKKSDLPQALKEMLSTKRFVFFVGFMGSGKSSLAHEMAREIKVKFIDLDDYIAEHEERTVYNIITQDGEAYFRDMEKLYLGVLEDEVPGSVLVATGGGTPCFKGNMTWMNKKGHTVFLDVAEDVLYQRLLADRENRPLIGDLSDEALKTFISKTLAKRRKYYEKSRYVVGL